MFLGFFLAKSLDGIDIIRTFASAFAQNLRRSQGREALKSSLKDLHRQK